MNPAVLQGIRLAEADHRAGKLDAAKARLEQLLLMDPTNTACLGLLGAICFQQGNAMDAQRLLCESLRHDPSQLGVMSNLAVVMRATQQPAEALKIQQQLISLDAANPSNHYNLGNTLLQLNRYDAAAEAYRKAVELNPRHVGAMLNLSRTLRLMLEVDESLRWLERATALDSTPLSRSAQIFVSMFSDVPPDKVAQLASEWDARFGAAVRTSSPPVSFQNSKEPDRALRIGYVGPVFRAHAVGYLIEPILRAHTVSFEVYCYSEVTQPDQMTQRLADSAKVFRSTANLSDAELWERIRADQVDILVDLNLHMAGSRLTLLARRAAPVQVNYLAYPFTSGVAEMDFRVTDEILDPPGAPPFGPETLLRLKSCFWLYAPDTSAPAPSPDLSAMNAGQFTFGCLNSTRKLNAPLARAWAHILAAVPNSRIVLFADDVGSQRPYIHRLFTAAGIDAQRIELVGPEPHHFHLKRYTQIDLCLDPFPYGGHTSMLDAMWMGVPTVTLSGLAPYQRAGASILHRVGLNELVTRTVDEYVATATQLAKDTRRLCSIRKGLRERMHASALCDTVRFVDEYERLLRTVWVRYCSGHAKSD